MDELSINVPDSSIDITDGIDIEEEKESFI